jgi:hypothetical protein
MSIRSLGEATTRIPEPITQPRAEPVHAPKEASSAFGRLLEGLGKEINTGERTMHNAMAAGRGGESVPPSELLALQAGVYRYGEAVDLASKLIDRTSSGVKTVINGGGQ